MHHIGIPSVLIFSLCAFFGVGTLDLVEQLTCPEAVHGAKMTASRELHSRSAENPLICLELSRRIDEPWVFGEGFMQDGSCIQYMPVIVKILRAEGRLPLRLYALLNEDHFRKAPELFTEIIEKGSKNELFALARKVGNYGLIQYGEKIATSILSRDWQPGEIVTTGQIAEQWEPAFGKILLSLRSDAKESKISEVFVRAKGSFATYLKLEEQEMPSVWADSEDFMNFWNEATIKED